MKKIKQMKGKLLLFLTTAIFILCAAFLIVSCGNKSQQKAKDSNAAASAVDFSTAASGGPCPVAPCYGLATGTTLNPVPSIDRSPFTLEAWVKRTGTLNASIFGFMDSKGGMLYVKNNVPKFVIRRNPTTTDVAAANRTALSECVSNGVTTTECIVPAVTQAGSVSSATAIYTIPGTAAITSTISSAITVNSASPAATFIPAVTSTVTQIQLSSGTADAVTLPAGAYQAFPTPGVASTTFTATVNAVTDHTNFNLGQNQWYHIAGVLTSEDQSGGPNNCAVDTDGNVTLQGAEQPHLAIYINGALTNCAGANGQYAGTSGEGRYSIATGGFELLSNGVSFLDFIAGIDNPSLGWSGGNFEGVIDEVRAWNYARPASKIAKCMNTELGIGGGDCDRDPGLIGYYRFNEGEGKDITDISGNGFSGSFEDGAAKEYEHGWVEPGAPISPAD